MPSLSSMEFHSLPVQAFLFLGGRTVAMSADIVSGTQFFLMVSVRCWTLITQYGLSFLRMKSLYVGCFAVLELFLFTPTGGPWTGNDCLLSKPDVSYAFVVIVLKSVHITQYGLSFLGIKLFYGGCFAVFGLLVFTASGESWTDKDSLLRKPDVSYAFVVVVLKSVRRGENGSINFSLEKYSCQKSSTQYAQGTLPDKSEGFVEGISSLVGSGR